MKRKLFFLLCALLTSVGMWADVKTDYTSSVNNAQAGWTGATGTYGNAKATDGTTLNIAERYWGHNSVSGAGVSIFSQTVNGLPNGTYMVVYYATANNARCPKADGGIQEDASDLVYVYAGSDKSHKAYVTSHKAESYTYPGEYIVSGAVVTDGTLELGMYAEKTGTQWQTIQVKALLRTDAVSEDGVDMTAAIVNAKVSNGEGWTGANTNSGQQYTGAPDNTYLDRNNAEANMYQQISLPAGKYIVQAATRASTSQGTAYLYLLEVGAIDLDTHDVEKKGNTGNVLGNGWGWTFLCFTLNEAKTVQLGLYMNKSSWVSVDDFRLYKVDDGVPTDVVDALSSMILTTPKMNADVRSAQTTAKSTLESSKTYENFKALRNAIDAAGTSVAAYATAAPVVAKMQTLLDNTNFYTTTTYNNFNAYITNYENELLTNDQATNLNNTIFSSTKNAGLAAKLIMSNFEINGDASNPAYYANTWSTEGNTDGSNMTTPFLEYWVSDANSLSDRVIKATQTGLESSTTYAIRALVRVRKSNGSAEATPSGIKMQVGSGTEVDVCGGTNVNTNFWFGTYTATGTSDESGNLDLKFNVDDTNASWLAVKNITYLKLDFSELVTAISNTEAVVGFEDGEYAPYANTAKMTALTNAKNVLNGTTSVSTQDEIDGYTDALNNAAWTAANTGSVNAVYNPMFSLSTNDGAMAGWETDNSAGLGGETHARAFVLTDGMTNYDKLEVFEQGDETRSCAFLRFDGTYSSISTKYTYGKTSGYTMPLKAEVLYRLTLQLGGWGQNGKNIKVAITNEAGAEVASETETTDSKPVSGADGVLTDYSFDFRPTTTGNYYMVISNTSGQNNAIVVSNISLMSVDELAEHTEAVKDGDITSLVQNPDFQSAATGWNGYTSYQTGLKRGWRGENVADKFIERTSTGAMAQTIYNMPAGTYKVVAAARGYNGGKITASINGTTGSTLNCTGDTQSGNAEINTNGVQMPYSSAGGFTKDNNGHNWQWISATAVLNEAGNLTISFNTEGTAWMAIDDVHLYYMSDAYSGHSATATYCMTAPTIGASQLVANNGKVTTCDLIVTNPNAIVRSQSVINTAAGEQMNNNYTNTDGRVMNKMVLYDGYDYTDYDIFEPFRITYGAILYRELQADTWSSLVVPFYPINLDEMKVPSSYSDGTLTFENAPGQNMNNVPMLVKSTAGVNYIEGRRNGTYGTGYGDNITVGDLTMNAVYTAGKIAASTDDLANFAVGSDNNLHKVTGSNVNIKAFRAYFSIAGGETLARIALDLDGTTAINAIETIETETLKDGKYLIRGKIVIVKNGVKYSANGQILK